MKNPIEDFDVFKCAEYFLSIEEMTHKKLQKLVYYSYAWFLTLNNDNSNELTNKLFSTQPQAWVHGPVFSNLYQKYKQYRWTYITKLNQSENIPPELEKFLLMIWENYGQFDADQLEMLTHAEDPWKETFSKSDDGSGGSSTISDELIFTYYSGLII